MYAMHYSLAWLPHGGQSGRINSSIHTMYVQTHI